MTTRAIHLEIAGDLTTDSFILALRRFITRRGNVKHIRSDNGTNFKGAQKELQDTIAEIKIPKVISKLVKKHVNFIWTFNPPSSPWKGGAWEALIKSVKRTLKAIARDRLFTEDVLHTFVWRSRIHIKQSTHHTFKRRYQRLRSTDSQSHLAWAFIVKLCTRCISRRRHQL